MLYKQGLPGAARGGGRVESPALSGDRRGCIPGTARLCELFKAGVSGRVGHREAIELLASWWLPFAWGPATALPDPTSQYTLYNSGLEIH